MSMMLENHHTSLGRKQREIIKFLAQNGPKTMNEVAKSLSLDYAYTNRTFKKLISRKLVQSISEKKHYRGQKFEKYGLTQQGVLAALNVGADPNSTIQYVRKYLRKNEYLPFQVLIQAIKVRALKPENASELRRKNKIKIPFPSWFDDSRKESILYIERSFPDIFYNLFVMFDLEILKRFDFLSQEKFLQLFPTLVGMLTIYCLSKLPDFRKRYMRGDDLHLPGGAFFKDYKKFESFINGALKVISQEGLHPWEYIKMKGNHIYWDDQYPEE